MSLPKSIKKIRKHWRLTQLEFAEEFGLTRARLLNYERATSEPPLEVLVELEKKSGITVRQLYEGGFSLEGVPLRPGDFSSVSRKATSPAAGEAPNSMEFEKLANAVKDMQLDMVKLKRAFEGMDEGEKKKMEVFVALQTVIKYVEEGMDESEYLVEKKEYLAKLAAHLSGE